MVRCDNNIPSFDGVSTVFLQRMMGFGERLREERRRLGLTQGDLAAVASIATNTQANYEKGTRNPDSAYLAAVAGAGVDVLYVLTGQRTPRVEEGLNEREQAVLDNYRALPEEDKSAVQRLTHALKESAPVDKDSGKTGTK